MIKLTKQHQYYFTSVCLHSQKRSDDGGVNGTGLRWLRFVTFAPNKKEAEKLATRYAMSKMEGDEMFYVSLRNGESKDVIDLYHKNYIYDSRDLLARGLYTGALPTE